MFFDKRFFVFPVHRNTKQPLILDMLNAASNDDNQIIEWMRKFPSCNWGLSCAKSGLVVVDVDLNHGGLSFWGALTAQHGEPVTLTARTGSGGLHYVFKAREGKKYKGKIIKGIDIKHNGLIVIAPSVNKNGLPYQWINEEEINDYPEWLEDLMEKRYSSSPDQAFKPSASSSHLEKCAEILREQELSYEEWVQAGMAIHSASPDEKGLQIFLYLTHGVNFVEGDHEKAVDKWKSFSTSGGISARTLSHLIREKGLTPPRLTEEEDLEALRQNIKDEFQRKRRENIGFVIEDDQFICRDKEQVVDHFHKEGFAYCPIDHKAPIIRVIKTENQGKHKLDSMGVHGFFNDTAAYFYETIKPNAEFVRTPAAKVWLESASRKQIDNIIFNPRTLENDESVFNLWAGFPMEGNTCEGRPEKILEMIQISLCNGDEQKAEWLLNWLAHIIQKPWEKATTVPVFTGEEGTGKGILADLILGGMLKELYVCVRSSLQLTQQFNAHLVGRLVTHIDEASWRGNKTEDGIMKNIIGSDSISIEEKFKARYTIANFSRYMVSSNNKEAVALPIGNRRYCMIETSPLWAGKPEKFKPVLEAIRHNWEVEKFYNLLKRRDISHFDPHQILKENRDGSESKIATEGIVAEFWHDLFCENPRPIFLEGQLSRKDLYDGFIDFAKKCSTYERNYTTKNFWSQTQKIFPYLKAENASLKRINSGWMRFHSGVDIKRLKSDFSTRLSIKDSVIEFPQSAYEIKNEFVEDIFS